ncbi:MAG: hypothetical protein K6T91_07295 [Firmicutes bacterium]|nr:hypothetical protein [Bacillota bacterium]
MLKIKEVEVFSWNTLVVGFMIWIKTAPINIVLSIIPLGFILTFNIMGYITNTYYKQPVKFFSMECFRVGIKVYFRYLIFFLLALVIAIAMSYITVALGLPDMIWAGLFILVLLLSIFLGHGWAVKRVGLLMQEAGNFIEDTKPTATEAFKVCPNCEAEFPSNVSHCSGCGETLVDAKSYYS